VLPVRFRGQEIPPGVVVAAPLVRMAVAGMSFGAQLAAGGTHRSATRRRISSGVAPSALLGGRGGDRPDSQQGRGGGLYMPGGRGGAGRGRGDQQDFQNGGGRGRGLGIVDPSGRRLPIGGTPPPQGGMVGTSLEMPGGTPAPTYNKYRPPAGFSQEESNEWEQLDASLKAMDSNQLMDMLSTQSGYWHTLGKVIPLLNRAGFDTKLLEDISGIDSRVQNQWMISGSVYDSLVISGLFTKEELSYFDDMASGPEMLGELRFVDSTDRRMAAGKYIVKHRLNQEEAFRLARAVKDYERRKADETEGFLDTPADCMALKYFRDCVEQQKNEAELERALKKGLACPDLSPSATSKLQSFLTLADAPEASAESARALPVPTFEYVRFTGDEIGYRPIGIAGTYGQLDAMGVEQVTVSKTSTDFGFFSETGGGHKWMVMPSWRAVTFAKRPYGIFVPECSQVQVLSRDLHQGSEVSAKQSAKDGAGVVLVDKDFGAIDDACWYIAPSAAGPVELVPGSQTAGRPVLGRVLLVVKTPKRAQGVQDLPLQL